MVKGPPSTDAIPDKQDWGRNDTGYHRSPPVVFEQRGARLVLSGSPNNYFMRRFVSDMLVLRVTHLVRVCSSDYHTAILENAGIVVIDMVFADGTFPPDDVIGRWLDLVRDRSADQPGCGVAVHCQSGLGRSAALVAVALVELGMRVDEAVATLRGNLRGALNAAQLMHLDRYIPRSRPRSVRSWSVYAASYRASDAAGRKATAQALCPHTSEDNSKPAAPQNATESAQNASPAAQDMLTRAQNALVPAPSLMSVQHSGFRWRKIFCCTDSKESQHAGLSK